MDRWLLWMQEHEKATLVISVSVSILAVLGSIAVAARI